MRSKKGDNLRVLGNILWIILGGGIFLFLEYLLSGLVLCLTIIGIPFGIQCIKLSFLALLPFGKEIHHSEKSTGCLSTLKLRNIPRSQSPSGFVLCELLLTRKMPRMPTVPTFPFMTI